MLQQMQSNQQFVVLTVAKDSLAMTTIYLEIMFGTENVSIRNLNVQMGYGGDEKKKGKNKFNNYQCEMCVG